ncbi:MULTISPECIES: hypothetical protein [Spongiibacter]|uniref:hypothetical protein n=1 Tax=Spongiibacter TaxID=630749 RepID=UPI0003B4F187|nr:MULTISPECIES: hypothetical protein [Spongiibacter]MBU70854.1 hypothetical protein [Spongiibacter sp.]
MAIKLFSKLFGSDEVVGKAVDGVYNGVDKLVFTDEEKSERFAILLKLYEPFKLAQRLLAMIFGIPYAFGWLITFLASFFTSVEEQIELLSGDMGSIVLAIVAFYFLGGAGESLLRGRGK